VCTLLEKGVCTVELGGTMTKSTLLAGGISKSYGNFKILKFDRRTVGSASVYTRDRPGAWSDRGSAGNLCVKKFEIFFCLLLRVHGLVLPVVLTRTHCTL
jgi:hypothetical protein